MTVVVEIEDETVQQLEFSFAEGAIVSICSVLCIGNR